MPHPEPQVSSTPAQLPTPAATQLPAPRSAPVLTPPVPALNRLASDPIALPKPNPSIEEPSLPQAGINAPKATTTPFPTQPVVESSQPTEEAQTAATDSFSSVQEAADEAAVHIGDESLSRLPSRKKRKLPWAAINHQQDGELSEDIAAPPENTRRKTKAKPNTYDNNDADADHAEQHADDNGSQNTRERVSAKVRGKRKTVDSAGGDDDQNVPKRARKSKKAKPVVTEEAETEGGDSQPADNAELITARRKPRQPKKRKKKATDNEGDQGEGSQPKRKGRPPREPTPSDAEDQIIDPDQTYMNSLASCNIRVGKLSNREREMRKIDWAAVRERRREEDSRPIQSRQEQEAADKALAEAGAALDVQQAESGPRFREIDGRIEMIPDSGTINREADADREIAEYEVVEDQDITVRITSRSFLKNNKRFPNDFILPGQGRRWNTESTDLFYQGLKSFGTDFQMISQMFPGSTRRSIKTKFTREERENPERVREALHGQSEIISHWDVFLEASQRNEESFVDADEIKRQLAEDAAIMRAKIEAAKLETEERNRQRIAAGVLDDEDGDQAGNKENGKGKKTKDKGRQVTFQEEAGLEIIGTIDDDDTWGQE